MFFVLGGMNVSTGRYVGSLFSGNRRVCRVMGQSD